MSDIKFTLIQLQTFLAVVDHGSFSAAARALDRAQSAVSHAIGQLESHLSVVLFDRSGRTPVLTLAGQALCEESRGVLRRAWDLEAMAQDWGSAQEQTHFSLVVDMIFPVDRLVAILAALRRAHPRLSLTVHTEARGAVTARLLDENCELGVTALLLPELPTQIQTLPMGTIEFLAVVAPDHPLARTPGPIPLDVLRRHTQLVLEDRSQLSTDQQVGVVGVNTWRIGGQGAKHGLLLGGFGWGSMPLPMVKDDLAAGRLVRIDPAHWAGRSLRLPLYAIHRIDRPPGPVTRDAIRLLQEVSRAPLD